MKKESKRTFIDTTDVKVLCIKGDVHCEIDFNYSVIDRYNMDGWSVYVINSDGVFMFINNIDCDGFDYCKISKK